MTRIGMRSTWFWFLITAVSLWAPSDAAAGEDEGLPFGEMRDTNIERFNEAAKRHGVDVEAELEKAYKGDEEALARVFGLADHWNVLDEVAKVYGNLLFSTFLNLSESRGDEWFAKAVSIQPPRVQQRIRDFLYYAISRVPPTQQAGIDKEVRRDHPLVFPAGYIFGQGDALFD